MDPEVVGAPAPAAPSEPVVPSPVADAVAKGDVRAFRRERRKERIDGVAAPVLSKLAESTPAAPAVPASSTDERIEAASEPADKPASDKGLKRATELKSEIDGLLGRRKALKDEVDALETRKRSATADQPAATAPAAETKPAPAAETKQAEWQRIKALPGAPKVDQFESYEDYSIALGLFVADTREAEKAAKATADQTKADADRVLGEVTASWRTKVDAARKVYADFDAVALQAPTTIRPGSVIDAWILESDKGAEVLYYLQKHPEQVARIDALSQINAARALTQIESELGKPPLKTITDAPAPVTAIGKKGSDPVDPIGSAVAKGDFAAFRREKRARLASGAGA